MRYGCVNLLILFYECEKYNNKHLWMQKAGFLKN